MSGELFTEAEVQRYFLEEISDAGGPKKWLRKNGLTGESHIYHMVQDGRAATLPRFLDALKLRKVIRYEPIPAALKSEQPK